ncbi:MAG: hypothetical protein P8181_11820, partial [bacterium]
FDVLIKFVVPLALLLVLGYSVWIEIEGGLFGSSYAENYNEKFGFLRLAPRFVLGYWLIVCSVAALLLARRGSFAKSD